MTLLLGRSKIEEMSRSWNRIELIGHLTRDPELRKTTQGFSVCGFGLATNRVWVSAKGARQEETSYHRIIAWSQLGDLCAELLKEGSFVFVSGRLSYRTYQKDDETRQVAEVIITEMLLLDRRVGRPREEESQLLRTQRDPIESQDEIPFS